ncbi:HNH endonuclease [Sunxiuqinia sp. A32]|uniref:HNH endonuclease n=1 Tax=Sunxiuqinia sp. A32 TaxID=3461496 RepID=UPI0040457128
MNGEKYLNVWVLKIFPSEEARRKDIYYSITLNQNIKVDLVSNDYENRDIQREIEYFMRKFSKLRKMTLHKHQITSERFGFDYTVYFVDLIKSIDHELDIYCQSRNSLKILPLALFPDFKSDRELTNRVSLLNEIKTKRIAESSLLLWHILLNNKTPVDQLADELISDLNEEDINPTFPPRFNPINLDNYNEKVQRGKLKVLRKGGKKKPKKKSQNGKEYWSRDPDIAFTALAKAKFKCEFNSSHTSFISETSRKNYMEGHHLVPMKYQEKFQISLDVPENIISLCPTCHRAIHFATLKYKEEMIRKFFKRRINALRSREVNINFDELRDYYNIS